MTDEEYKQGLTALRLIAKQPEGKRALRFLIENCDYYTSAFISDPYRNAYSEGRRSVAGQLDEMLGRDIFLTVLATKL